MSLAAYEAVGKLCVTAGNAVFLVIDVSLEMGEGVICELNPHWKTEAFRAAPPGAPLPLLCA